MPITFARAVLILSPLCSCLGAHPTVMPDALPPAVAGSALVPHLFAPGTISGPADDTSPTFCPDGSCVLFARSNASYSTLLVSFQHDGQWSPPEIAPFSGTWKDMEPAMSPDGSFLVFASNRPSIGGGQPIDGTYDGRTLPGGGGALWRVGRRGDTWTEPVRLPDVLNSNTSVFSPCVVQDGSIYFMQPEGPPGTFHIYKSEFQGGAYGTPVRVNLGDADTEEVDPAVAPDESFIVFSSRHPSLHDKNRLHIAFRSGQGWTHPTDLGDVTNEKGSNIEARLGPEHRTLYFSTNTVPPASDSPTREETRRALLDMGVSANGNENIWFVPMAPYLTHATGDR
jgi:WD40-like Beta Propeller Repeat